MKYKIDKLIDLSSFTHDNKLLLINYLNEILSFGFPEFNGLRYQDGYIPHKILKGHSHIASIDSFESGAMIDFQNADAQLIQMYFNKDGYTINNGSSSYFEEIYLKKSIVKDEDNKNVVESANDYEIAFYYGNDVISIKTKNNGEKLNCRISIYLDVSHYKVELSKIDDYLDPDFFAEFDKVDEAYEYIEDGIVNDYLSRVCPYLGKLPNNNRNINPASLRLFGISTLIKYRKIVRNYTSPKDDKEKRR